MKPSASPRPYVLGWTRVDDDTGGGHSFTNFEQIYLEGDDDDARGVLRGLFEQDPASSTPEYGEVFQFHRGPSLASVSWFARGCDWDREKREPIERARTSWEPLVPLADFVAGCDTDLDRAREHSKNWRASRHGKRLLLGRAATLAARMWSGEGYVDPVSTSRRAEELLETMRSAPADARGFVAATAARAWAQWEGRAPRAAPGEERPALWLDRVEASDVAWLASNMAGRDARDLVFLDMALAGSILRRGERSLLAGLSDAELSAIGSRAAARAALGDRDQIGAEPLAALTAAAEAESLSRSIGAGAPREGGAPRL